MTFSDSFNNVKLVISTNTKKQFQIYSLFLKIDTEIVEKLKILSCAHQQNFYLDIVPYLPYNSYIKS
jgi:hypothetical protein